MQLYSSPASPYVRKVNVLAIEKGLAARIEDIATVLTPIAPDAALCDANPLGKIPALRLDDGRVLYDSRVICEYIDSLHDGTPALPASGDARFDVLTRQALADGLLDAAILTRYETFLRPEALRWPEWIEGQAAKIQRSLDAMQTQVADAGERFDLGDITFACALSYMDFRYADQDWRARREALAAWYEGVASRPSMQATIPA